MKTEYLFVRLSVLHERAVSKKLNAYVADGWRVVSHADTDHEYSFVLVRERPETP